MKEKLCCAGILPLILLTFGLLLCACEPEPRSRSFGGVQIPGLFVRESARDIPVAAEADIIVAGGTTAGVEAALAAAHAGARVFLFTDRTYLGEDICSTYRFWLEKGEIPQTDLSLAVFSGNAHSPSVPFTYESDTVSSPKHPDTPQPSRLGDGRWESAATDSVQYDGDVTITLALDREYDVTALRVMAYYRKGDFGVASVKIHAGTNGTDYKPLGTIAGAAYPTADTYDPIILAKNLSAQCRYLKLEFRKKADASRILLGEIQLLADHSDTPFMQNYPRPMHIKRTLEQQLLAANVTFLFGCYPTDVLEDDKGRIRGLVIANRSGRQAILAGKIIDATPRAAVARMAGARFRDYPSGPQTFERVIFGGSPGMAEDILAAQSYPAPVWTPTIEKTNLPDGSPWINGPPADWDGTFINYTLEIDMPDGSFASYANAEQVARDLTFSPDMFDEAPRLWQIPPDPVYAHKSAAEWPGADAIDLGVFRPVDVDDIFVLGGCADVSRAGAEKMLRPTEYMKLGSRIGRCAAGEMQRDLSFDLSRISLRTFSASGTVIDTARVKEQLVGFRPTDRLKTSVRSKERALPVLGQYDVVVVGGGTGGAPAGISAARHGADTLVIEFQDGLGGVRTLGMIGIYYFGYLDGYTAEIDRAVRAMGPKAEAPKADGTNVWNIEYLKEWTRSEIRKAGGKIWFSSLGCGAYVENGSVKGVVVATPAGRGVVLAERVIDSTGSADIAIAAGADYVFTGADNAAVQGTGISPRNLYTIERHRVHWYANTDYTFVDDTDMWDVWRAYVGAREQYSSHWDIAYLINSRERRRIVGDYTLDPLDIINRRVFEDTIHIARSNFDSHGFTIHPVFILTPPHEELMYAYVPYRCLLPRGLDNILVTGLGVSAHRDAMPIIRMEPDIQNQGYAAGMIAAKTVKEGVGLREVNLDEVRQELLEKRILTDDVFNLRPMKEHGGVHANADLYDGGDHAPFTKERIAQAADHLRHEYRDLPIVLEHFEEVRPLLRKYYSEAASSDEKLIYAHVLGMMGDPTGNAALIEHIRNTPWDEGWNFRGGGQYGGSVSPLDSKIIALGQSGDAAGLDVIIEKIDQLTPEDGFSHFRAVALACENIGDKRAARHLAGLLQKPGMTGHYVTADSIKINPTNFVTSRSLSLREIIVARALFRCGDHEGIGAHILYNYRNDLRGHYSRHAAAILEEQNAK